MSASKQEMKNVTEQREFYLIGVRDGSAGGKKRCTHEQYEAGYEIGGFWRSHGVLMVEQETAGRC